MAASVVSDLTNELSCPVFTPADDDYDREVAGFDLSILHTAPVVGAGSASDVAAAVRAAAGHDLPVTMLGTGHGMVAPITSGVIVSTRRMTGVTVDQSRRVALVQAGATWRQVLDATTPYGLAPVCGSAPDVGVVGLLLGGGLGPIARSVGFSSDHVLAFDIVSADGEISRADAETNPELFWALRGAGQELDVAVTAAELQLLSIRTLYGGGLYYQTKDIDTLLLSWANWVTDSKEPIPDALSTSLAILRLPDHPGLPPELRGQTVAHLRVAALGAPATARRILEPFISVATPISGTLSSMPYAHIGAIHADPTVPTPHQSGGLLLDTLTSDTVRAILDTAGPDTVRPPGIVELRHLTGAASRPPNPDDSTTGRDAVANLWVSVTTDAAGPDVASASTAMVRAVLDATRPWSHSAVQRNFVGTENTAVEKQNAWSAADWARITDIRTQVHSA